MLFVRVFCCLILTLLAVSCGEKADSDAKAQATVRQEEEPVMKSESEGELNQLQSGVHLQMKYNAETDAFEGTVRNATMLPIDSIQITLKLSSGTVLGPTDPIDLKPARPYSISIPAEGAKFDTWSAHVLIAGHSTAGH